MDKYFWKNFKLRMSMIWAIINSRQIIVIYTKPKKGTNYSWDCKSTKTVRELLDKVSKEFKSKKK